MSRANAVHVPIGREKSSPIAREPVPKRSPILTFSAREGPFSRFWDSLLERLLGVGMTHAVKQEVYRGVVVGESEMTAADESRPGVVSRDAESSALTGPAATRRAPRLGRTGDVSTQHLDGPPPDPGGKCHFGGPVEPVSRKAHGLLWYSGNPSIDGQASGVGRLDFCEGRTFRKE